MPQALSANNIQRASSQEKAGIYLVISEKVITFETMSRSYSRSKILK